MTDNQTGEILPRTEGLPLLSFVSDECGPLELYPLGTRCGSIDYAARSNSRESETEKADSVRNFHSIRGMPSNYSEEFSERKVA